MSEHIAQRSRARIFLNWLAGMLVALLVVGGVGTPALAAGGKVTINPVTSSESPSGLPVLTEGGEYPFQIGYGMMDDGAVVEVTLPKGITIPEAALVVPKTNTAVESLSMSADGKLVITFMSPFPGDVNQGVLDLKFKLETVEQSEVRDLVWEHDGQTTTQKVIVTTPDDKPQETGTWASKETIEGKSLPHTVENGRVVIDPSVLDTEIVYSVVVSSKDAREVRLVDTLGPNLVLVDGSLAGTKTVRNEHGMTPVETALTQLPNISGTGFEYDFAAEANSVYSFTYSAKIADQAALDAITAELQAAYDAVDKIDGGNYSVALKNTATVNDVEYRSESVIGSRVEGLPRPGTGKGFTKQVDPTKVELDEVLAPGATLEAGIPATYTLGADLRVFNGFQDGPFELKRNVVIRDVLPAEAEWNASADDFIVLTNAAGDSVKLTRAADIEGNVEAGIAADDHRFQYTIVGNELYVNLGNDIAENYTLAVKATITSLPKKASGETPYVNHFSVKNNAYFIFAEGNRGYEGKDAKTTITVQKDTSGGVDDRDKFEKSTAGGTITASPGSVVEIPYHFTVGANVGDASTSRVIDVVDHQVFNVTEETLPQIKDTISGTYGNGHALDGDTFDLSIDADGNLVIAPNAEFPKDAAQGEAAKPYTERWDITVSLPTHELKGKRSFDVTNSARYEGEGQELVFLSTSKTKATTFGNEMEVRKHVYDAANDEFTDNLRVELAEDGTPLTEEFIYRVELMPHGSFSSMVEDVVDVLPAGLEFAGFVKPEDVASGNIVGETEYQVPGSKIVAKYDAAKNTVSLERGVLESGKTLALYFKVKLVDFEQDVSITNMIGAVGATVTPTKEYPLSLLKRDSTNATKLITDERARFSVLAADQKTVVLKDLRVVDGKIITAEGKTPVVADTGDYWLRENVSPEGYIRSKELTPISVGQDGKAPAVTLFNEPRLLGDPAETYAIGDVVWIDAYKNGVQDPTEQVLPGVTVELYHGDELVGTTKTDDRGRYIFDKLPAGTYRVKFTLTKEQQKIYEFTSQNSGDDRGIDSDADPKTGFTTTIVLGPDNINLTDDYAWADVEASEGIDPTWDAGVIVRDIDPGTTGPDPEKKPEPSKPTVDPAKPGTATVSELPSTGGAAPFVVGGIAALLLAAGAALLMRRRTARG